MAALGISDLTSGSYLQTLMQQLAAKATATPATTATTPTTTATTTDTQATAGTTQSASSTPHHHHKRAEFFKQIETAVTTALQTAQSDGSSTDPNKVIEDTIAKFFKDNNISLPTPASGNDASAAASQNTNSTSQASAQQEASPGSVRQAFFDLLKNFGVSPQQFRNDFLTAIKDAQAGQANTATALQSIPVGSSINTLA
jgi:hypothetical protein